MKARFTLGLAMLLVSVLPGNAWAIIAGFNVDIHMDKDGVIANDFHIEGRIKSGPPGSNWLNPPILVGHIDDLFPNFQPDIQPDPGSPDQNEFFFKADWWGREYKYCEILHLGLFFDLECHNLVIDLVGWWTRDGKPIGGVNGGAVPIPGFIVRDQPEQGPQTFTIRNDSSQGQQEGIRQRIMQMGLVGMTREELERRFGSPEQAFKELRLGGLEGQLDWIPVANAEGPISPTNSLDFVPDSFFDVFLDITMPPIRELHPVRPIHIGEGDFLFAKTLVAFANNNGDPAPDFRWIWHMHEAHYPPQEPGGDLGDAPDSTNSFGAPMWAYPAGMPGPGIIPANFPTVYGAGSPPWGPIHRNPMPIHLGPVVTLENEADIGPDMDGVNNIVPPPNMSDMDGADDGVIPFGLKWCQQNQFQFIVTVQPTPVQLPPMFVNVWFDWNTDGDWDDTVMCPTGQTPVPEWAVQNQPLGVLPPGQHVIPTLPFDAWWPLGPADMPLGQVWMRITLSEIPWQPVAGAIGFGGSGPQQGYNFGETEDYVVPVPLELEMDFGDAPDSATAPGYPTLLPIGARHAITPNLTLGAFIDAEPDGQPDATATGDDAAGFVDDEDGVVFSPLVAGQPAQAIVMVQGQGVLQAWIDFNRVNAWADPGEQIAVDLPVGPGPNPVPFIVPAGFAGTTFARFRLSTVRGLGFGGAAPNGEVEDYMVKVEKPAVEVDDYTDSTAEVEVLMPDGTSNTVLMSGSSKMNVYFEGVNQGDAGDNDGDGRDDVLAELVSLNLTGNSPLGPVTIRLRAGAPATGEMEEQANTTPGRLDVAPFTGAGTVDSFFDIFVEVDVAGVTLHTAVPMRSQAVLHHKPAEPCDTYYSTVMVDLLDASGRPTGYRIRLAEYVPIRCRFDWGDAPDQMREGNYPTLAASNGARHDIDPHIFLGDLIDPERDGQPNGNATGDDLSKLDDEDGVKFLTWPLIPGRWAKIEVKASVVGALYGWVDFDVDGTWTQSGNQVFASQTLAAGVNTLKFFVPMTAKPNCSTFARFRFTRSLVAIGFDGPAPNGEVEDYIVKVGENCGIKWVQKPDITPNGVDIRVDNSDGLLRTIADDFLCTSHDLITDVHLWGSWLGDQKGVIKKIHLSIHSDDPAGPGGPDPQNGYSKPDKLLWQKDFFADDFKEELVVHVPEGEFWWDAPEVLIPAGDKQIWRVDIKIDPKDAFLQEGSPDKPVVYWLDVRVELAQEPGAAPHAFGWKTRQWPEHFNDDAVMALGNMPPLFWHELRYPPRHPYYQMELNSIDMAFAITSRGFCCDSADLNCDGFVDMEDFAIFASQWLLMVP